MGENHSIRALRGLRRFLYEVVERVAEHLREDEVHPHPGANYGLERPSLNPSGGQAYLQVPVDIARVNEEIGTGYGNRIILSNAPRAIAYTKYLIGHNQAPIGKIYNVSSLNARNAGVQPS